MNAFSRTALVAVVFTAGAAGVPVDRATADAKTWNAASGSWSTPQNWLPQGVPGASDDAEILNGGVVTLDDIETQIRTLGLGRFNLTGGGGTVHISTAAASLTSANGFIANGPSSSGTVTVSAFADWTNAGSFFVGAEGTGRLEILSAAELNRLYNEQLFIESSFLVGYLAGAAVPGNDGRSDVRSCSLPAMYAAAATRRSDRLKPINSSAPLSRRQSR